MALGRIEDVATNLNDMESVAEIQLLRYQKALLAGQYKTAGEVLEGGEKQSIGLEPILADLAKNKIGPNEFALAELTKWPPHTLGVGALPALVFQRVLAERAGRVYQVREILLGKMQQDGQYFYRRGVLSLLEGDIPAAKQWFTQTTRKAPAGWGLSDYHNPNAEEYLRLIEIAEKAAKAP
jgi:hypothetical protein